MDKAIIVRGVTKKYKLFNNTKERLYSLISPHKYGEDFYALTNVDFEANHGEVIGFIGINGSGKSTLSNIIAGIVPETSGNVKVNGQAALIAVAAGLKNDLTGRDNIELKLLMLGFNKEEIKALEPDIIEFSELEKFIDQPVKSYSSGMRSRLGFAISVNVNPDILIIDEALSVGDKAFAEKSLNKMEEFKSEGKTMIFVSHSIGQMKQFCEKILWLEYGQVKEYGPVEEIMPKYEEFLKKWQKMKKKDRVKYRNAAISNQKKILAGKKEQNEVDINDFLKEKRPNNIYKETPVSYVGRISGNDPHIYISPKDRSNAKSIKKYRDHTFYIKRKSIYEDDLFYLLSKKPSGIDGTIGWVRATDLSTHRHILIDRDKKVFTLTGKGRGYDKPWGSVGDSVIENLEPYKGQVFTVIETNIVGKSAWYKGEIEEKPGTLVWIYFKRLDSIEYE